MVINEWIIIPGVFILLSLVYLFGFRIGRKKAEEKGEKQLNRVSSVQAGIMGLLGVMLAFSFSLSTMRYEQRRQLIIQESVKIGTAYFRAGLLNDTLRPEVRKLLKQYLDERLNFYKEGNTEEEMERVYERSRKIQILIWYNTAQLGRKSPNLNTNVNILALNDMIETTGNISSLFQSHVPRGILILLVFISICTIVILGYGDGLLNEKNKAFSFILNLVLCSILFLIIDMDRPTSGFLKADTYGLKELKMEIEKYTSVQKLKQ